MTSFWFENKIFFLCGYIRNNVLVIEELCIEKPSRHRGYGSRVVKALKQYAKRKRYQLQAVNIMETAEQFWRNEGFLGTRTVMFLKTT